MFLVSSSNFCFTSAFSVGDNNSNSLSNKKSSLVLIGWNSDSVKNSGIVGCIGAKPLSLRNSCVGSLVSNCSSSCCGSVGKLSTGLTGLSLPKRKLRASSSLLLLFRKSNRPNYSPSPSIISSGLW